MEKEYIVNLDLPASERWAFLKNHAAEIDELIECYLSDLAGETSIFDIIGLYKQQLIPTSYLEEIDFIASISKYSADQILIANLYYDVLKFYFGCTAFAFNNADTVVHARNLDWHTENNLLSTHSKIFNFQRGGKTVYKTVGWAGFVGALSGTKPGKFSVTLNAVLSNDSPEVAMPISFLLRDVLDSAESFNEAKRQLEATIIVSDCLLLLSGVNVGEMAVIERTPSRFATRVPESGKGYIVVTNDYKKLQNNETDDSILQSTSCGRFDRATLLLSSEQDLSFRECIQVLSDENIKMGITVQQMVFNNRTGEVALIKT
ncbi:C45 family autoproteolytic acyltransferase/hydolase [Chondrinema litorale]|uniref:C45 family autoproteolytic acyltransferase/hydolase n=1 Tax=Chondrinema litorale TaxID=2994555 RepID=UPI002542E75E|nr:C45 family autoproteolytic acyltransferase/hydolase [Chondrinema litorale]UZR95255.1 C45 family autoproteolytic acyltransferase/hydrolase [Chondrinema litorale]